MSHFLDVFTEFIFMSAFKNLSVRMLLTDLPFALVSWSHLNIVLATEPTPATPQPVPASTRITRALTFKSRVSEGIKQQSSHQARQE